MGLIVIYIFFCVLVAGLVMVALWVGLKSEYDEEKMSSFECGFISFQGARLAFSLQFFLVAIIFLIFDVEIALILPLPVVLTYSIGLSILFIFLVFVVVVLGGLYYEWGSGVLEWAY